MYCKIDGNSGRSLSERWAKEEQERLVKVNGQIQDLLTETNFRLEERIGGLEKQIGKMKSCNNCKNRPSEYNFLDDCNRFCCGCIKNSNWELR